MGDEPDFWRMRRTAPRPAHLLAKKKSSYRDREVAVLSASSHASRPTLSRSSLGKKSQASHSHSYYPTDEEGAHVETPEIVVNPPSSESRSAPGSKSYSYYSSDAPPPAPSVGLRSSSAPKSGNSYSYYSTEESQFKVSAAPQSDSSYQKNLSLSYIHPSEYKQSSSYGYDQYKYSHSGSYVSSHSTKKSSGYADERRSHSTKKS